MVVHVPNGAHLAGTKEERARQWAALVKDGCVPGFPDLLVIGKRGDWGLLEMKSALGKLSDDQGEVRDELMKRGVRWAVARSPDEALNIVRGWGI